MTDIDCTRGIFIKPNIVFPVESGSGEITSPSFVKTFILALQRALRQISISYSVKVSQPAAIRQENFHVSGYAQACS